MVEPEGHALRDRLAAWLEPQLDALAAARPKLPDALDDRAQDGWEPLLAIADLAGGRWPERARAAALAFSAGREGDDASWGVRLLADLRAIFGDAERLSSADACAGLNALEESPWGGWREGKGIDQRTLARHLRPYDVVPGTMRLPDASQAKGYTREKLTDAWARYCPSEPVPEPAVTDGSPSQPYHRHNPHGDRDGAGTDDPWAEPIRTAGNSHGERDVTVVRTRPGSGRTWRILTDEDVAENEVYADRFRRSEG